MKLGKVIGEAALAAVGIVSMGSLAFDAIPAPLNTAIFGGGAGLLAATVAVSTRNRSKPIGEVGVLPGIPVEQKGRRSRATPKKSVEKEKLLKKYDRAFGQMLSRHGEGTRTETLERMHKVLYELSPDIKAWTGDARLRIYLLMKEISKDLDDPATADGGLKLLHLILSKGGESAIEMARPVFGEKIQTMYQDPKYENARFVPRLMLMLDGYDAKKVERMTKEAIHVWPETRFSAARQYLGLEELGQRGIRKDIKGMLGAEIAKAGLDGDRTALNRSLELYHEVI